LVISAEEDSIQVHACFNELVIPAGYSMEEVNKQLSILVKYGAGGFGQL
jgi:hypothetical protein